MQMLSWEPPSLRQEVQESGEYGAQGGSTSLLTARPLVTAALHWHQALHREENLRWLWLRVVTEARARACSHHRHFLPLCTIGARGHGLVQASVGAGWSHLGWTSIVGVTTL